MLIDFKFTNYKSFKNTTELDLSATKVMEYPHHIVECAGEKILPTAAIYGANASGKTNVYDALNFMKYYVLNSFAFGDDSVRANRLNSKFTIEYLKPIPFLFDSGSKDSDISFEVWITISGEEKDCIYNYGFSLNNEKVIEEWLNYKTKTGRKYKPVFYREIGKLPEYYTIPKRYSDNLNVSLNDATLLLSLGSKLKIENFEKIYSWFSSLTLLNFGNPVDNILLSFMMPQGFENKEEVRKNVVRYINTFDTSIVDFSVETINNSDNSKEFRIYSVHKNRDTGNLISIPFQEESAGTRKMFAIYSSLQMVLNTGAVLFIDELNDRLHPLLVRNLIQTFLDRNRNKNHAQLIFTTHDVWHLDANLLRRDEIWFIEKGIDEVSLLYSLVDFKGENGDKIRNDENILRNYLRGKYGAIPLLNEIHI